MTHNQLPVNSVTGETPLDLALRLQRGINVNRIKGETEYGIEMVFTANELRVLWLALADHLYTRHGIAMRQINEAYKSAYGNDEDILRTEEMKKIWRESTKSQRDVK